MTLSRDKMLRGMYHRDGALNGRYLVGVTSTRIYCLPDCPARKPKAENVVFFIREQDARNAGFRPCKRCRPDNFYQGVDADLAVLTALLNRARVDAAEFPNVQALVKTSGFGSTKLTSLMLDHFHVSPAVLLRRLRVDQAARMLVHEGLAPSDACFASGFGSLATFYQQFRAANGMTPASYGELPGKAEFEIALPRDYTREGIAGLLGRDPESTNQGFTGRKGYKALRLSGQPVRMDIEIRNASAHVHLHAAKLPPMASFEAHAIALRLLGLRQPRPASTTLREAPWSTLIAPAPELRPALYADPFEALVWAVVGQQINIRFAATLIRRINALLGARCQSDNVLVAEPNELANVDVEDLVRLQCSRAKAQTIIRLSQAIATGELSLSTLAASGASAARSRLEHYKGIGPWSSEYVLMRGLGFTDCLPLGDSGLRNGAGNFFSLGERPDSSAIASAMAVYAPYRSLATHHIWMSHT